MSIEWNLLWQKDVHSGFEAYEKYFYMSEDLV